MNRLTKPPNVVEVRRKYGKHVKFGVYCASVIDVFRLYSIRRSMRCCGGSSIAGALCFVAINCVTVASAQVADPVLTVSQSGSSSTANVSIYEATSGTTLYYTNDGTAPSTSSSVVPSSGTVTVSIGSTLKVQAYQGTAVPSDVVTVNYSSNGSISSGSGHSLVLKNDGSIWATGSNSSGQFGTGGVGTASLPIQVPFTGASAVAGVTSTTAIVENGLPQSWEIKYFGQTGLNPSALAPNGTGLTILQCYQQGVNPLPSPATTPFSIGVSSTGPFQTPASPVVVAAITHPSTTTIASVKFYNGSALLGTVTQAPWQYQLSNLTPNSYSITATATDNTGASVSGNTQFIVTQSNYYNRGSNSDAVYQSSVIALDSEQGTDLDGRQGSDPNNNFANFYPTSKYSIYPWFLRTLGETNELWKHITGISNGSPSYATYNALPTANGLTVGGEPPLVAFGSQGGGTTLYTNQTYSFGVTAGGQLDYAPVTVSSVNNSSGVLTTTTNHGLHVGQMIVISGATGETALNGTFLVNSIPSANQLTLSSAIGGAVALSGTYTSGSAAVTNADIKVEVYQASNFASGSKIAPVYVQGFTIPQTNNPTAWSAFVANSYVQDDHILQNYSGTTIDFDTQVQLVPANGSASSWGQQVNYALLVTHKAANSLYYYKVSYMGVTASDNGGTDVPNSTSDSAMAVDSTGMNEVWNLSYTLDFVNASAWQSIAINQPHFQETPVPSSYAGQSVDELVHNTPAVTDTLDAPGSTALNNLGLTSLVTVDNSPELRDHPVLDQFVASLNNDPMALANYVLNQINLTNAIGYDTTAAGTADKSINPQGVARDALATFLEGQGSPVEQDALLIYFLRKAGYSCAYVFPAQDQTLMFDEQMSKMLHVQIRSEENPLTQTVPELVPVNYPWVAAYINGKWVHIFPWLKDTVANEGADLWNYLPNGYQTGSQWLLHYVLNDPTIRQLKTASGQSSDDVNVLFPLYVQQQLQNTNLSIDDLGIQFYNRQNNFTRWQDFPRPWQTPTISDNNLAQSLDYTQNPSALTPALQNIFDTVSVQVLSDRNNNGQADTGEPVINTGAMRMVDLHDRRLLLYHQVASTQGSNAPTYNLILSLEPFSSSHTSGPYTFNSNATYNGTANADPGDLMNQQYASVVLQTKPTTDSPPDNDDSLLYTITYNRHRQAQAIPTVTNTWATFLGLNETLSVTDTRYLRKGDMACLGLDYGQVTDKMQEFQAEKYWNYQQAVQANPNTTPNPELAEGQILYLMAQSYFRDLSSLQTNVQSWTKTNSVSQIVYGLSKLSPFRNSDGSPNLINGSVNLRYPRVDMVLRQVAFLGNGTDNESSGDASINTLSNAFALLTGGGSADEHLVLNSFFQQASAVSTVKLLDIAQGWTPTTGVAAHPGTGPVLLTSSTYNTVGTQVYPGNSGNGTFNHTLEYWSGWTNTSQPVPSGSLWASFVSVFSDPTYGAFSSVYVTPGPQTAVGQAGQAYTGMGALVEGVTSTGAYITDNMVINNGGYSGDPGIPFSGASSSSGSPTQSSSLTDNLNLNLGDDGYTVTYTGDDSSTSASYSPTSISSNDFSSIDSDYSNSSLLLTPDGQNSLTDFELDTGASTTLGNTGTSVANGETLLQNIGFAGDASYYGTMQSSVGISTGFNLTGIGTAVYDPVDAVTGEFYVNSLDVRLNGPMPLEIRRVYGSLNQANNSFGYGWRMSYFPYLTLSSNAVYNAGNTQLTTPPTLIYAAEMDGSVIAYRQQSSPNTRWIPLPQDNPTLANVGNSGIGGTENPFNNRIDESTVSGTTVFNLTGADGSVRTFSVASFPTAGTSPISRTRPYLQKWVDNRGNYYSFAFGSNSNSTDYGQVNLIQSSNGDFVRFQYDTFGHIIRAFTGDGRILSYGYDAYGDLTQVTLPDASVIGYQYQHATAPAATGTAVAGNGTYGANSATITSDNNLAITSATNANPTVITTASAHGLQVGQVVIIAGATGNTAINGSFTVGSIPSSTTATLLSGAIAAAPFSTHLIIQENKPNGRVLENTYSSANSYSDRRVQTQLATVGANETLLQNASFNYGSPTKNADGTSSGSTVITDVNGNTTTYDYSESQITEVDYPAQNGSNSGQHSNGPKTTQSWYTSTGSGAYQRSLSGRTDRRGLGTSYRYDGNGNLLTLSVTGNLTGGGSNGEVSTTTMTYNSSTAVSLPGGGSTIPNTLASTSDQLGNGTSYVYGDSNHPYEPTITNTLASGGTSSSSAQQYQDVSSGSVSAHGLLTQQTLASGSPDQATTQYTYSANGFLTSRTQDTESNDPNIVTNYTYDLRGEVTSETNAASGRSTRYAYDARGNRTGTERYDESGNLIGWEYGYYDGNGDLQWKQGSRYSPVDYTYYQYDGAGRLTGQIEYLIGAQSNGAGVTSNGYATTLNQFDSFGNLIEKDDPNQNATTMTYDALGEMLGRVVHAGSGSGTALSIESFSYEPGGLVASQSTMLGGHDSRTYTSQGQLKTETLPDGTTKSFLYDLTGRVVKEVLGSGSYWATSYNDSGRVVTRTFYNAGGSQLMQESQSFDRRGNVISKTDVASNTFSATYDGLNRPKTWQGPSASGTSAQQSTVTVYDAAGEVTSVTNAAGERTLTNYDALNRPTLITVFNGDGSISSKTSNYYSPDHQSVATTKGSGAANSANPAVTTTVYTDTRGNPVLLKHADGSYQVTGYDPNGNKTSYQDEQGEVTSWTYDALNRPVTRALPASVPANAQITTYTYTLNSPGETINQAMSTNEAGQSLAQKTVLDAAGRRSAEELDGNGGAATRNYSYSYYTSGTGAGQLQTANDPRGFSTTTTYDAWSRPSTVASTGSSVAQQNQTTTYGYDNRGMVNSVAQSYASGSTGPSTLTTRGFDGYGNINAETVSVGGSTVSQWTQSWNSAGRRSALNSQVTTLGSATGNYAFGYNADGHLTAEAQAGVNYSYSYGDNQLLTQRVSPWRTQTINSRDLRGRILGETSTTGTSTELTEVMTWRSDERLASYAVTGGIQAGETRAYQYDARGRVLVEPFLMTGAANPSYLPNGQQSASFYFDQSGTGGSNEGGLGVLTFAYVNGYTGSDVVAQTNWQQSGSNYYYAGNGGYAPWTNSFDAAGNMSGRVDQASGTVYNTQTYLWDSFNRLVKVSQRNTGASDFDWTTVYDGFGRRVQTVAQPMSSGVNSGTPTTYTYYYDPQVEFLELGQLSNNSSSSPVSDRTWKVYGPDRSGVYGGVQGIGGLENRVDEAAATAKQPFNNYFGDSLGETVISNLTGSTIQSGPTSYGLILGGYGPEAGTSWMASQRPEWRGHYLDSYTNFVYMGGRYYDSIFGRFLSADPDGVNASMSLYDYANGDAVNGLDPDGRFGVGALDALDGNIPANSPTSSSFNAGFSVGTGLASLQAGLTTLNNEEVAAYNPLTYYNSALQYGSNVSSEYNQYGLLTASEYAATSWNVGAIESAVVNVDPVTGAPVGDVGQRLQLGLSGVAGTTSILAPIEGGLSNLGESELSSTVTNPVPSSLARVVDADLANSPTLGAPGASDVFVTSADEISGITNSQDLAARLTLVDSSGNLRQGPFSVIQFDTPPSGVSSPVFRTNPGFVQGGLTGGGASEFTIPNQPISGLQNVTTRTIP